MIACAVEPVLSISTVRRWHHFRFSVTVLKHAVDRREAELIPVVLEVNGRGATDTAFHLFLINHHVHS